MSRGNFQDSRFLFPLIHSHLTCRVGPPLVAGIYMHPVTPILWRSRKRYQPDQSAPSAATWPQTPEFVCLFVFLSVTTCEHLPSPLDRNRINTRHCLQLDSCVTWWGMQFVPKWDGKQSTSDIAKKIFHVHFFIFRAAVGLISVLYENQLAGTWNSLKWSFKSCLIQMRLIRKPHPGGVLKGLWERSRNCVRSLIYRPVARYCICERSCRKPFVVSEGAALHPCSRLH